MICYFRWSAISGMISRAQSIMAKLRVPVNDEMGVGMDGQGWL